MDVCTGGRDFHQSITSRYTQQTRLKIAVSGGGEAKKNSDLENNIPGGEHDMKGPASQCVHAYQSITLTNQPLTAGLLFSLHKDQEIEGNKYSLGGPSGGVYTRD